MTEAKLELDLVFVIAFLAFSGIVAALGLPLWVVAGRRRRHTTIRNYAAGGAIVVLLCATVEVASRRAEAQCEAVGNPSCYDPGGPGLQMVMLGVYLIFTWYVAYMMWRD